jgi:UDP-N-acetylglucosamine 2-epimerase
MLEGIETILRDRNPDAVVVYGDTNSTVAAALAAAKLHIAVVHVEAGLRSFNRRMPEEINRIVTDHVADWLLAPTPTAVRNLEAENLRARTIFTGDVMFDAVLDIRARTRGRPASGAGAGLEPYAYGVVTVHRAENTTPAILRELLEVLNEVATDHLPLVFPVHPRSAQLLKTELKDWRPAPRFRIVEPLGPLDMIRLVDGARMVLTDSGGLQKEAYFLDCPCVTLRQETEWIETVQAGANVVTGASRDRVVKAVRGWLEQPARPGFSNRPGDAPFGNGHAADAIVAAIASINTGSSG